ncbi:unnamed protein product, partial [Prorocentrum cordatum]
MRPPAAWDRAATLGTRAGDLLSGVLAAAARGLLPRGPLALPACPRRAAAGAEHEAALAAAAPICSDARSAPAKEAAAELPSAAPHAFPEK